MVIHEFTDRGGESIKCLFIFWFEAALNMNNTHPKKQVYEVLSALCSYNNMGYNNVMNALAALKVLI